MAEYVFYIEWSDGSDRDEFTIETLPDFVTPRPKRKKFEMEVSSLPGFRFEGETLQKIAPIVTHIPLGVSEYGAEIAISGKAIPLATFDSLRLKEGSPDICKYYDAFSNTLYNVNVTEVDCAYIKGTLAMDYNIKMKTVRT